MTPDNSDRICRSIVDLVNHEIQEDTEPLQILIGVLGGLYCYLKTCPEEYRPLSLQVRQIAVSSCLHELLLAEEKRGFDTAPTT